MKLLKYSLIVLVLLALAGWFFLFRSVPLKVSPETTLLTEPLTEDGRLVDYASWLAAQFPKDGNTAKNSARGMLELFGPGLYDVRNFKPEHWKLLGLEPIPENQEPRFTLPKSDDFSGKFASVYHELEECFAVDPEGFRAWVNALSPALDAMAEVLQNSEFYAFPLLAKGPDSLFSAEILDASQAREVAINFQARAFLREKEGDLEGAEADRIAIMKLGRQMQNGAQVISHLLIGRAIEQMGSKPDLLEKMETLEPVDQEKNLRRVLEMERIMSASGVQNLYRTTRDGSVNDFPINGATWILLHLGMDWNIAAKRVNEALQRVYFPEENAEPYQIPQRRLNGFSPKLLSLRARSEIFGDVLALNLCLNISQLNDCFSDSKEVENGDANDEQVEGVIVP
ncbi:MAG: hypothetical protein IJQ31_10820 [Thermoguttaceae bacterium]|nr:hypothetical protein [Thermoguttaceae bacterium]